MSEEVQGACCSDQSQESSQVEQKTIYPVSHTWLVHTEPPSRDEDVVLLADLCGESVCRQISVVGFFYNNLLPGFFSGYV